MMNKSKLEQLLSFIILWLLLLPIGIFQRIIPIYSTAKKKDLIKRSEINNIDELSITDFVKFFATLFQKKGYDVELTNNGDNGSILTLIANGSKTVAQVIKSSQPIDLEAMREVLGVKENYKVENLVVVTNNYFTSAAKEQAKRSNISIWDRDILINEIIDVFKKNIKPQTTKIFLSKVLTDFKLILGILAFFFIYIPVVNYFLFPSDTSSLSHNQNAGESQIIKNSNSSNTNNKNNSNTPNSDISNINNTNSDTTNTDSTDSDASQENISPNNNPVEIDQGIIIAFESELSDIRNERDSIPIVINDFKNELNSALDNQSIYFERINSKYNKFNELIKSVNGNNISDINSLSGMIDFESNNVAYEQVIVNNKINNLKGEVKISNNLLKRIATQESLSKNNKKIGADEYESLLKRYIPIADDIQKFIVDATESIDKGSSESGNMTKQAKYMALKTKKIAAQLSAKYLNK